ncbi:MAG: hypothetical protein AAFZ07_19590 [Actinomycetota bacterium]
MPDPSIRSFTNDDSESGTASVSMPAGATAGDFVFVFISTRAGNDVTTVPAEFTRIETELSSGNLFYRLFVGGEAASYTFGPSGGWSWIAVAVIGDGVGTLLTEGSLEVDFGKTSVDAPSVAGASAGDLLVVFTGGEDSTQDLSLPGGSDLTLTHFQDANNRSPQLVAWDSLTADGATGARQIDLAAADNSEVHSFSVVIQAAPDTAGGLEAIVLADAGTATPTATGAAVESLAAVDTTDGTPTTTGAAIESSAITDTSSATATAPGGAVEQTAITDTVSASATAPGGGDEVLGIAETGEATATAPGGGDELVALAETSSGTATAPGQAVEGIALLEAVIAGAAVVAGSVEQFVIVDLAAAAQLAGGIETVALVDTVAGTPTAVGGAVEGIALTELTSATALAPGTAVEGIVTADTGTGTTTTTGAAVELVAMVDTASIVQARVVTGAAEALIVTETVTAFPATSFAFEGVVLATTVTGTPQAAGQAVELLALADEQAQLDVVAGGGYEALVVVDIDGVSHVIAATVITVPAPTRRVTVPAPTRNITVPARRS